MKLVNKIVINIQKSFFVLLIIPFLIASCKSDDIEKGTPSLPSEFSSKSIQLIIDNFEEEEVLIVGSSGRQFIVSFINDKGLSFELVEAELPVILKDNEGTKWDIFGLAVDGNRKGEQLKTTNNMMAYWFSVATFFPGIDLYGEGRKVTDFTPKEPSNDWLIPLEGVYSGTIRDGIPALEEPYFLKYTSKNRLDNIFYLQDDDLVLGIRINNKIRLYSHAILNWHEIVNDTIGNEEIAIVYCPLTGTAGAWDRNINGQTTTFGVSGLLYNNNIIPYDRLTGSLWSQIRQDCINGQQIGKKVQPFQLVEMTFKTWDEIYGGDNNPLVILSPETGTNRDYTTYPYGEYKTNELIPFPVSYLDKRLHPKERVHTVIIGEKAKAYRFSDFN